MTRIKPRDPFISQIELDKWLVAEYHRLLSQNPNDKTLLFERIRLNDSFERVRKYLTAEQKR